MTKSIILSFSFYLFIACNQKAEILQDDPTPQDSVRKKNQIRMEKITEIHLKEQEGAYIGKIHKIKIKKNKIFLMDSSRKQILIFLKEGKFIRTLGRSGEGPGEFRYLYTMDVKDHFVACFDQGNLRITLFDTSGVFIRSFGTRTQDSVPLGNCVAITPYHTILHCQQPIKLTKDQDVAHNYPWLICEFDTLGNVLSHHGKFNQQIVNRQVIGDKIDKSFTELKWSFPHFITSTSENTHTYLWFENIPVIVGYGKDNAVSKVFNVATPITKPPWISKNEKRLQQLSGEARRRLARQLENQHSIHTFIGDIIYIDKYSVLLILQTEVVRRGFFDQTSTHYLSAYDVNTGHRLMTDMLLPSETPLFPQCIAVDTDGFVYCIQSDKPDNFVIAKYEIVRETL